MKKMLIFICLLIVAFGTITTANNQFNTANNQFNRDKLIDKSFVINYKGFYSPNDSYYSNQLLFAIENNTKDTLYLSLNDIKLEVVKNGKILSQDRLPKVGNLFPPDFLEDITFFTDKAYKKTAAQKNQKRQLSILLKKAFAEKLFLKNFGKKNIEKNFINAVVSDCLVLLPKERINFSKLFISKSLDATCVVKVEYKKSGIFTFYNDENGNDVAIKY